MYEVFYSLIPPCASEKVIILSLITIEHVVFPLASVDEVLMHAACRKRLKLGQTLAKHC